MFFRSTAEYMPESEEEVEQFKLVSDFRKRVERERPCLYKTYSSVEEWKEEVITGICDWLDNDLPEKWLNKINSRMKIFISCSSEWEIDRPELIEKLEGFVSADNGVIIGDKGMGKTYSFLTLCNNFKENNIPYLLLSVEDLGDGTKETLRERLEFTGSLTQILKKIRSKFNHQKGFIIIDGFDAAKDEDKRDNFIYQSQNEFQIT